MCFRICTLRVHTTISGTRHICHIAVLHTLVLHSPESGTRNFCRTVDTSTRPFINAITSNRAKRLRTVTRIVKVPAAPHVLRRIFHSPHRLRSWRLLAERATKKRSLAFSPILPYLSPTNNPTYPYLSLPLPESILPYSTNNIPKTHKIPPPLQREEAKILSSKNFSLRNALVPITQYLFA